jgi:hypothetical protein
MMCALIYGARSRDYIRIWEHEADLNLFDETLFDGEATVSDINSWSH